MSGDALLRPRAGVAGDVVPALRAALSMLGKPYTYGAHPGDTTCFDCSSFVQWAWEQAGIRLPRIASEQLRLLPRVDIERLAPGDLVFFNIDGGTWKYRFAGVDHVALYLDDGRIIEAGNSASGVKITDLWRKGAPVGAARPADQRRDRRTSRFS